MHFCFISLVVSMQGLRVNVQLIEAATERHIWAERYADE